MSLAHMVWAFEQRGLSPMEKFVLVALAEYADKTTGECWPSIPRVVEDTGLAESTVRKYMNAMVKRGVIGREYVFREDGSQTSNRYHFPITTPPRDGGGPLRQTEPAPPADGGLEPSSEPVITNRSAYGGAEEKNGTPVSALVAKYAESSVPPPPPRARARVGRELRQLYEQGYGEYLDAALDTLIAKKLDPSLLSQLVAEQIPQHNEELEGVLSWLHTKEER